MDGLMMAAGMILGESIDYFVSTAVLGEVMSRPVSQPNSVSAASYNSSIPHATIAHASGIHDTIR
jgi:hypothetical protein